MRLLRRIFWGLLLLLGVMAGAAFLLPKDLAVERLTVINAPPEKVFPYLNDFRKFNEWSPWVKRDPNMTHEFSGPQSGVGAKMAWKSDKPDVGEGTSTITGSEEPSLVFGESEFAGLKATTKLELNPIDGGTAVGWSFETDLGNNPLARWFGLLFAKLIAADYDEGLERLKLLMETGSPEART